MAVERIPHFDDGSYWLVPHPPFQRISTEVGKTLAMATLSGDSHVPSLPTSALSYPPYELKEYITLRRALRVVVVNPEFNRIQRRDAEAQRRDELQPGLSATLRVRVKIPPNVPSR